MAALLSIGEFSRLTHVSVKALRHYHDLGLLEPAAVDPATGYRSYATGQVPTAQVIRRFRELDMPLDQVKRIVHAADVAERDEALVAHLGRLERQLDRTHAAVASLRALLDGTPPALPIVYRTIPAACALAVSEEVAWDDAEGWLTDVLTEIAAAAGTRRAGPDGALYSAAFFESHVGEVTAFVPVTERVDAPGRPQLLDIPGGRFALTVHEGPFADLDQTYGLLGTFVAERALASPGPTRENYVVTEADTPDPGALRTEVCWPIARTPA